MPALPIVASDVYEWGPGAQFVVHTACGRAGELGSGGVEIIRYDAEGRTYRTHFFDNQGAVTEEELTIDGLSWTWQGSGRAATARSARMEPALRQTTSARTTAASGLRRSR
jgi:hypothetical protein